MIEDGIESRVGVEGNATQRQYVVVADDAEAFKFLSRGSRHPQAEHAIGQQTYEYRHHHDDQEHYDLLLVDLRQQDRAL